MIKLEIHPKTLIFKKPAGTSRGIYTEHKIWLLHATDPEQPQKSGWGEVAPLPNLSCEYDSNFESILFDTCNKFTGKIDYQKLINYPSILFGIESALDDFNAFQQPLYDTPFANGNASISINGLIWMGSFDEMENRLKSKIAEGFHCIKIKIGAIDFEKELALIKSIRKRYTEKEITIRLDANGGFSTDEAMDKLSQLSKYNIHSIEQPIKAGQYSAMEALCKNSPIPIALDEELIGINLTEQKKTLLDKINPNYIILKPSLHGGKKGCEEWIQLAEERKIGYWITSALESNVGLMHIAQWASQFPISIPQGLGTGGLYTNNIDVPLQLIGEQLWYKPDDKFTRFPKKMV